MFCPIPRLLRPQDCYLDGYCIEPKPRWAQKVALGCASVGAQCACFLSEVFLVKNQFFNKRHLSAGRLSPNDSVDFIIIYEKIAVTG